MEYYGRTRTTEAGKWVADLWEIPGGACHRPPDWSTNEAFNELQAFCWSLHKGHIVWDLEVGCIRPGNARYLGGYR